MKLWIRAIRTSLILYAITLGLIVVYSIPQIIGFSSWKEFSSCWRSVFFEIELEKNSHIQQIEHEKREYAGAPSGYVSKYAIKLDNGLKIFITSMGKDSMKYDWQILSVGDIIVYKVNSIHREARVDIDNDLITIPFVYEDVDDIFVSTISISDINHFLPSIKSLADIINTSEVIYAWIKELPFETRPFEFFSYKSYINPHTRKKFRENEIFSMDMVSDIYNNMTSSFSYSLSKPSEVRRDLKYKKGTSMWGLDKYSKSASYSFYRMNLDDHHVPETEDVTAIIPEYYDW